VTAHALPGGPAIGAPFDVLTGDGLAGLRSLPAQSVDLVFTSPPYARRRAYARIHPDEYVDWFLPWAAEIERVLRPTGSFVLNATA